MIKTMSLISFILFSLNSFSSTIKEEIHFEIENSHVAPLQDYSSARKYLFGKLHYENGTVLDVYCGNRYTEEDGVGEMKIPDPNKLNCEHTWPQSKFNKQFPAIIQKTDLHHLFPVNSLANSTRSNYPFSNVKGGELDNCSISKRGHRADGQGVFEVPDFHKGNVARAMFYFSVRYNSPIDNVQETYLREWNKIDPVDSEEILRNDKIQAIQGNRNPFIDQPELIDKIENF